MRLLVEVNSSTFLTKMDKKDKIRACYQHACLRYVSNNQMINVSLRKRFSIEDKNYSVASRIIADTMNAGLVKPHDPESTSCKHAKYVPRSGHDCILCSCGAHFDGN